MFLKLKNYEVTIKGRGCADGRKFQGWISKEYAPTLTISTEILMLLCMIDAMEVWEVEISDIPGAFLQTNHKREIYISICKGWCSPYSKR